MTKEFEELKKISPVIARIIKSIAHILDKDNTPTGLCPEILIAQIFIDVYNNHNTTIDKAIIEYKVAH